MHKFRIDFHRAPPPSAAGWLLAAAGLACVAAGGWEQYDQHLRQQAQASRLARLQASDSAALAADKPDDPALAAAKQAVQRAQLPWRNLFAALERASSDDVALLAVAPDVARRQVKIEAEARNFAAMLAFQRQLQAQPALANVVLMDHSIVKDVPEMPVRFHMQAGWGGERVLP